MSDFDSDKDHARLIWLRDIHTTQLVRELEARVSQAREHLASAIRNSDDPDVRDAAAALREVVELSDFVLKGDDD